MQRPVPDNAQHSQETDIHAPSGFEPTIPASQWIQIDASDHAATWIGDKRGYCMHFSVVLSTVSLADESHVKYPGCLNG
jgi:hypothetical protein